jgi:NADH:ubiquinone oxidoreductase subunit F (NADH-binding)
VLRNCGVIDPENINEYIAREGYSALEKVIFEMTPDEVIAEIKKSGLRAGEAQVFQPEINGHLHSRRLEM